MGTRRNGAKVALAALAVLAGCGGLGRGGGGTTDGGSADAGIADAGADATPPGDGGAECDEAHATIGPEGGTLTFCDATLVVEPGWLEAPIDFAIERVTAPPALREPFVIVGDAWRFSPATLPDVGRARIELAHASERPLDLARLDAGSGGEGSWTAFGACEQTATTISQTVWWELGVFAAITDGRDLPLAPTGIGEGTAELVLGDRSAQLATGAEGFLTDEDSLTGHRTFAFHGTADTLALSLELVIDPEGAATPLFLLAQDSATGETWQADVFGDPDALVAHAEHASGTLTATIDGTLSNGSIERTVSIALSGEPGPWWREPPRLCVEE